MNTKIKKIKRDRRRKRIKSKVFGTKEKPRFSVFKSNRYIVAQLIDDEKGATLAFATSKNMNGKTSFERSKQVGEEIAKQAKAKKIEKVVFDRGGYLYTGSIKSLADSARESGLKF